MKISEIIELLEDFSEEEGDMEMFIYDSFGNRISVESIQSGSVSRSSGITSYAYFSQID